MFLHMQNACFMRILLINERKHYFHLFLNALLVIYGNTLFGDLWKYSIYLLIKIYFTVYNYISFDIALPITAHYPSMLSHLLQSRK